MVSCSPENCNFSLSHWPQCYISAPHCVQHGRLFFFSSPGAVHHFSGAPLVNTVSLATVSKCVFMLVFPYMTYIRHGRKQNHCLSSIGHQFLTGVGELPGKSFVSGSSSRQQPNIQRGEKIQRHRHPMALHLTHVDHGSKDRENGPFS